jgi:hypothetical protein
MNPNESKQSERNPTQGNNEPIDGPDAGTEERRGQLNRDRDRADDSGRRRNDNQSEEAIPELDEDADIDGSADDPRRAGTDNKAGG